MNAALVYKLRGLSRSLCGNQETVIGSRIVVSAAKIQGKSARPTYAMRDNPRSQIEANSSEVYAAASNCHSAASHPV